MSNELKVFSFHSLLVAFNSPKLLKTQSVGYVFARHPFV